MRASGIFGEAAKVMRGSTIRSKAIAIIAVALFHATPAARLLAGPAQNERSGRPPAGDKDAGKELFMNNGCYGCHGREGQGATQATGPRIGPPLLSLEAFASYIHHPTGQMPPYTDKVVSERELADIYAYLQSVPKSRAGKDIPLLNQ